MLQTKKLGRRELLRGGGVAALAVGAAAVVPFAAKAKAPPPGLAENPSSDAKLLELGAACLAQVPIVKRLEKRSASLHERAMEGFPKGGWGLSNGVEFKRRSKATGYDVAYDRWNQASNVLEIDTKAMSKLSALTFAGLQMKARVIRAMENAFPGEHGAYDEVIAFEALRQSLVNDLLAGASEVRS